jgi:hypothetical protein
LAPFSLAEMGDMKLSVGDMVDLELSATVRSCCHSLLTTGAAEEALLLEEGGGSLLGSGGVLGCGVRAWVEL